MVIEQKSISQRRELCASLIPEFCETVAETDERIEFCFCRLARKAKIRLAIPVAALPRSTERTARLVGTRAAIRFGPELIGAG